MVVRRLCSTETLTAFSNSSAYITVLERQPMTHNFSPPLFHHCHSLTLPLSLRLSSETKDTQSAATPGDEEKIQKGPVQRFSHCFTLWQPSKNRTERDSEKLQPLPSQTRTLVFNTGSETGKKLITLSTKFVTILKFLTQLNTDTKDNPRYLNKQTQDL